SFPTTRDLVPLFSTGSALRPVLSLSNRLRFAGVTMRKKWSRRKFLETSLKASVVASGSSAVGVGQIKTPSQVRPSTQGFAPTASAFERNQQELLRAAMDEIIPAGDGMPAASEISGVDHLAEVAGEAADVQRQIIESLNALEALSGSLNGKIFTSLQRAE